MPGIGGDEHHFQSIILCERARELGAGRAVAQIDIDQREAAIRCRFERADPVRRDRLYRIARIDQDAFEIERNEDFVFDDKRGGGHDDHFGP